METTQSIKLTDIECIDNRKMEDIFCGAAVGGDGGLKNQFSVGRLVKKVKKKTRKNGMQPL